MILCKENYGTGEKTMVPFREQMNFDLLWKKSMEL